MIKVTNINIHMVVNKDPLKAFASITLEDCFVIHDLRIIKTDNKMFVAMPSKKNPDPNQKEAYKDIAHPINQITREKIEKMILDEYIKVIRSL